MKSETPPGAAGQVSAAPARDVLRFSSGEEETRTALRRLDQGLARCGLTSEQRATVELVLAEVLNNVTEHAYSWRTGEPVELSFDLIFGRLTVLVCDDGITLPGGKLPQGRPQVVDCPVQDLPEGGFGWNLIRAFTRSLHYERIGRRNVLTLEFSLENNS